MGTNKKKDDEPNASGRTSGMIYQSTTGISAGTNKRKRRNLMPPAGLAGLLPLVFNISRKYLKDILINILR